MWERLRLSPMLEFDSDIQDIQLAECVDLSVLITGEPGAGTADVAQLIHNRSQRSHAPLVAMCCANIPEARLEVEFRTHADRAYGGSLLLEDVDEIGDRGQEALLKFVQAAAITNPEDARRVVDVRVIATTAQPLFERVVARMFLDELYYRLNGIHIRIRPLREARDDIPWLIGHMLQDLGTRHQLTPPYIGPAAIASLQAYDWPGNMRELRDVLELLLISGRREVIEPDDLNAAIAAQSPKKTGATGFKTESRLFS